MRIVWIALMASQLTMADVSLKNGNVFFAFVTNAYPGGIEPKIEQSYNHKSSYKGPFGNKFGMEYFTYCSIGADGSIVVKEFGGGAQNRFSPRSENPKALSSAVDQIIKVARSSGAVSSATQIKNYRQKLLSDAQFRNQEWETYLERGKLKAAQVPQGAKLYSNRFSYQYITRISQGYVRVYDNGKTETFNNQCKLSEIKDKNGNYVQLSYGKDGKLAKLEDNFHRKMFFKYTNRGLISEVQGINGKTAYYKYDNKDNLTEIRDIKGNVFKFKYDKYSLLTELKYQDGSKVEISYWGADKLRSVRRYKDRDGTIREYDYLTKKSDPGYRGISVQVKTEDGKKVVAKSLYEYYLKNKASGEQWTYRLVTDFDGDRTDTTYNECCGLPISIKRNGQETTFAYDAKGRMTRKSTPTQVVEMKYDQKAGKVSQVKRYPKANKKKVEWAQYKYDAHGNLVFAKTSDKKAVQLFYDSNGRILSLVDQDRRQLRFKYNENSKPVEITAPKIGTLKVTWTAAGTLKDINSPQGRQIANEVVTLFRNLIAIVGEGGADFGFGG